MTITEIEDRVKGIAGDYESAHAAEDALHQDVLEAISKSSVGA